MRFYCMNYHFNTMLLVNFLPADATHISTWPLAFYHNQWKRQLLSKKNKSSFFFPRLRRRPCSDFSPPRLFQVQCQNQEVPGVQDADAAADQSAPDRSVCTQPSPSAKSAVVQTALFSFFLFSPSNWTEETV